MKHNLFFYGLLAVLSLSTASAADDPALGGNLPGLLDYARAHNPELEAARQEAAAAQYRTGSAAALPDPVLRTELMDITNQGTTSPRLLPSQAGSARYLLMQSISWYGKRDLQRAAAVAQASRAEGGVATSWAELASNIKSAYTMRYYTVAGERLNRQMLALLEQLEQIAQTRYANGLGSQQDVIRVQFEQTMLRSELIALQSDAHHAHTRMNALLSRPVNALLAEPVQLRTMPPPGILDEAALLERLRARNPQLQVAAADSLSAEKSRELAYVNRYPGFTLGVAPTQSGSEIRSWDLMLEMNIPLQQGARRAQEDEAEAMLAAAHARQQDLLNQVQAELSENLSALESARQTDSLIQANLLPQAELTYQAALAGYEAGKVEFAMLIEAQKQILKVRQQQLQIQVEMQLRLAAIEKLLGEEL